MLLLLLLLCLLLFFVCLICIGSLIRVDNVRVVVVVVGVVDNCRHHGVLIAGREGRFGRHRRPRLFIVVIITIALTLFFFCFVVVLFLVDVAQQEAVNVARERRSLGRYLAVTCVCAVGALGLHMFNWQKHTDRHGHLFFFFLFFVLAIVARLHGHTGARVANGSRRDERASRRIGVLVERDELARLHHGGRVEGATTHR